MRPRVASSSFCILLALMPCHPEVGGCFVYPVTATRVSEETGAARTGSWKIVHMGELPDLRKIIFTSSQNGHLLAFRESVYLSTDSGSSWAESRIVLPQYEHFEKVASDISSLILLDISFGDLHRGWISCSPSGLYRTENGGRSWKAKSYGWGGNPFHIFVFDGEEKGDQCLWMVCQSPIEGMWKGITVRRHEVVLQVDEKLGSSHFLSSKEGWILARSGKIYHTSNGGKNWQEFTAYGQEPQEDRGYSTARIYFLNPKTGWIVRNFGCSQPELIYLHFQERAYPGKPRAREFRETIKVGSGEVPACSRIYRSTDGGQSWILLRLLDDINLSSLVFLDELKGWAVGKLWRRKIKRGIILRTTDGGDTWDEEDVRPPVPLTNLCFADPSHGWAVGMSGSILKYSKEPIMYTVGNWFEDKECLWNISRRFYGNPCLWERIYEANRQAIANPHLVHPGKELKIP